MRNARPRDRIRTFFDVVVNAGSAGRPHMMIVPVRPAVFAIMMVLVEVFTDVITWIELDVAAI